VHFERVANIFDGTGTSGKRIFDIYIEGVNVLPKFDFVAEAGNQTLTAVSKTIVTTVTDGTLDIKFVGVLNNPQLNGIMVTVLSQKRSELLETPDRLAAASGASNVSQTAVSATNGASWMWIAAGFTVLAFLALFARWRMARKERTHAHNVAARNHVLTLN